MPASGRHWRSGVVGAGFVLAFTLRESGVRIVTGDVWLFASGLCAATGYVIFGKLSRGMPGWEVTCWALVASLPVTVAGSILTWNAEFLAASAASLAALGYSKEVAKGRYTLDESLIRHEDWMIKNPYLCGDEISFADLLAYHELASHVACAIMADAEWKKTSSCQSVVRQYQRAPAFAFGQ